MKIGIDIRPLQTGHSVRGIGQVTRQVTAELEKLKAPDDQLVLYVYENGEKIDTAPFGEDAITQELPQPKHARISKVLPWLNTEVDDIIRKTCDVYVQYDFKMGVPKHHPSVLLIHDQIPVIFGNKYPFSYLATYRTARRVGLSRRDALIEKALRRRVYLREMRKTLDRATEVLTVSKYVADDTVQFASLQRQKSLKITPALLGFTQPATVDGKLLAMEQTRMDELGLQANNFLFFIGGVDDRRRIDQLVAAFNNLRARGEDIKLVLGGYDFQPDMSAIFSPAALKAIESSSYREDICLLGFISDRERSWLYENAKAFVFPTEYEGFGLPILESLAEGCPVIVYKNSAVPEVAGPNTLMVEGWEGIVSAVGELDERSEKERGAAAKDGKAWTEKFTWKKTAKVFLEAAYRAKSN